MGRGWALLELTDAIILKKKENNAESHINTLH